MRQIRKRVRLLLAILCMVLALLSLLGTLNPVLGKVGAAALQARNDSYLEDAFHQALTGFGVMSGIKAGLAVVEGSTGGVSAGVSLNLQVGDVVQSVYDYVDIAWRTLLMGCICILSMQYLMEMISLVDAAVLSIFFGLCGICLCFRCTPRPLRDLRILTFFGVLVLYVLLPLSIFCSSLLSERITTPAIEAAQEGFDETGKQLFPDEEDLPDGMLARVRKIPERLEQIGTYLKKRSSEMALWTIQLIAGYLFDCIFFPLGCFLLMLWGTRMLLRYCVQCNLQNALYRELRQLKKIE